MSSHSNTEDRSLQYLIRAGQAGKSASVMAQQAATETGVRKLMCYGRAGVGFARMGALLARGILIEKRTTRQKGLHLG